MMIKKFKYSVELKYIKNKKLREQGVTLVALVVTIVIMLILAGVTLHLVLGDNGLIKQARKAVQKTSEVQNEEQKQLIISETVMNIENFEYIDKNGDKAIIPAGFIVSKVEGENIIKNGLVIMDSKENEFVWIPVDKEKFEQNFRRTERYAQKNLQNLLSGTGEVNKIGINHLMQLNGIDETDDTKKEAQEMYKSVEKNGGFFLSRYETGINKNGEIACKRDIEVCRGIKWGNSMIDDNDGVVEMSRNFYKNNNYSTVNSTLCYGVQWDAALNFIDSNYITNSVDNKPVCLQDSYVVDSTGKGNYTGEIAKTGSSLQYKQKNIYDMAGNVWEWTMEVCASATSRVVRGGSFVRNGIDTPSSSMASKDPSIGDINFGFRIALYLK